MTRNKVGTSFRLSPVALELISGLTDKLGLSQAGVVELAVRKLAEVENVVVSTAREKEKEAE